MTDTAKQYAGFWNRFLAFYIDQFIVLAVIAVIEKFFSYYKSYGSSGVIAKIEALFSLLIAFAYFSLLESSRLQATVGKKILGIRVTDMDGNRISFLRSIGRTLAKVPSFFIFFIGFLMQAFTKRRQALHDIIAGCLIVKFTESRHLILILVVILLLPIILLVVMSSILTSPSFLISLMSIFSK